MITESTSSIKACNSGVSGDKAKAKFGHGCNPSALYGKVALVIVVNAVEPEKCCVDHEVKVVVSYNDVEVCKV